MDRRSFIKLISASFASTPLIGLATPDKIQHIPKISALDQINIRRLILHIQTGISQLLEFHRYEINDSLTRDSLRSQSTALLESIKNTGLIVDYSVICDDTNNDNDNDIHILTIDMTIQPNRVPDMIELRFTMSN